MSRLLLLAMAVASLACEDKPHFTEPMTLGGRKVEPETLNQGRDLYNMHCVSCHGEDGSGNGPAAKSLKFPPRDFREASFSFVADGDLPSHEQLVDRISTGAPERGMPPWKGMREEDLSALADFIKTFSPRWQAGS
jgi:mono/diheme cytochrome c family protein